VIFGGYPTGLSTAMFPLFVSAMAFLLDFGIAPTLQQSGSAVCL